MQYNIEIEEIEKAEIEQPDHDSVIIVVFSYEPCQYKFFSKDIQLVSLAASKV